LGDNLLKKLFLLLIITFLIFTAGCQQNSPHKEDKKNTDYVEVVTAVPNYNYQIMKDQINKLDDKFSEIKVSSIGQSYQERNLYKLSLGQGNKKVAVIGGVHGREGLTSLLILKLIEDYAKHYQQNKAIGNYQLDKLLDKVTLVCIPMLNPDGIDIAVKGISTQQNKDFLIKANEGSHNFERWKANAQGVDLNKQFRADWENTKSSDTPHYTDYKGPAPESEPESKALVNLTRQGDFNSVICFHHSGRVIYWYYNQAPENIRRDRNLAEKISAINNYSLISPAESDTTAAGFKDWFIKEFKRPGFTIEIGYNGKSEKPLPSDKLNIFFKENRKVLLELADIL
jgi:g-D-glutamyl-meso-diaminopimelate peptidase